MGSGQMLLFPFLIILIHFPNIATAQVPDLIFYRCTNSVNYTTNSTYQSNLETVLSSLPSNTSNNYGFHNTSAGQGPDIVNVIALCSGDMSPDTCRSCISSATLKLREVDNFRLCNPSDVSSLDEFNTALGSLMNRIQDEAAAGGSLRKYATGNITGPDFSTIYGLMQCTPDLSMVQCQNCLIGTKSLMIPRCNGKQGERIAGSSCYLRYETYSFYNEIPAISLPSPPPSAGKRNNTRTTRTIILIVVPIISIVILVALICIIMRNRKERRLEEQNGEITDDIGNVESVQYNFSSISAATDDFSENNKLGEGGFGSVYKGRLQNGVQIAVKRLSSSSGQGEQEFKNEVVLVARLQHRNLVRLLGFCLERKERLLIFEFVPNASLDKFLFDAAKRADVDWDRRYKIIGGVARGLLYLHEDSRLRIIHRDLKASNGLLDAEMNAKIADFGTARLFMPEESQAKTNRIVGTYGYMAPEYALHGRFSVKSDVFSFGVLVLEIVSGRKNNFQNEESYEVLQSYAWENWQEGTISNVIDPILTEGSGGSMRDIVRCIHIGLLCVQERVADRPTMASIVLMLSSQSMSMPMPSKPAFFMHSVINPEMPLLESRLGTTDLTNRGSSQWSVNEASISDLNPR